MGSEQALTGAYLHVENAIVERHYRNIIFHQLVRTNGKNPYLFSKDYLTPP